MHLPDRGALGEPARPRRCRGSGRAGAGPSGPATRAKSRSPSRACGRRRTTRRRHVFEYARAGPAAPTYAARPCRRREHRLGTLAELVRAGHRPPGAGRSPRPTPARWPTRSVAARDHGAAASRWSAPATRSPTSPSPTACCCCPDRLTGIRAVDRDAMTVTVLAGTPLHVLNDAAARARAWPCTTSATSTGRPSPARSPPAPTAPVAGGPRCRRRWPRSSWSPPTGAVRAPAARTEDPDLFDGGPGRARRPRASLTAVTFAVEPAFTLEAVEEPMPLGRGGRRLRRPGRGQRPLRRCTGSRTPTGC